MTYSPYKSHRPFQDDVSALPAEGFDSWVKRVRRDVVVEPELLAEEERRLYAEASGRRERARKARRRVVSLQRWATASLLAACGSVALLLAGGPWWPAAASAVAFVVSLGATAVARRQESSGSGASLNTAFSRGQLVRIAELDTSGRELLARAQEAIAKVISSTVYRTDELDKQAGEIALRRHEWEIAYALRDITGLRAESEANPPQGPESARIREPQQRALAIAQEHTAARVSAIERYAARVKAADAALADREAAIYAARQNDRYLDLVARTAADEHAIADLARLTEQAAAAEQAYRDRIDQANQAGAALVFPLNGPPPAESGPPGQVADPGQ